MNERDQFIEPDIVMGLITSTDFLHRVRSIFKREYIEADYPAIVADWVFEYDDAHGQAPGRHIQDIFRDKMRAGAIRDDLMENIEVMLERISKEYEKGNEPPNYDYLFERTRKYFERQHGQQVLREVSDLFDADEHEKAVQCLHDYEPLTPANENAAAQTLADIYDQEFGQLDWLVRDLIPKGLTILAGRSKIGKSQFMVNLWLDLVLRRRIFDSFRGQSGPMLLLSLEDPAKRLHERMHSIAPELSIKDRDRLAHLTEVHHQWPALDKGGRAAIEAWLRRATKPKLVTIDTIAPVWSKKPSTGGAGLYAEDRAIFDPLAALAHRYDTSIIAVHHTTKGETQDPFNKILGGMGVQGAADNLIVLQDEPGESQRVRCLIRGKDVEQRDLLFEVDDYRWTFAGERGAVQKNKARQQLYDLIEVAGEPLSRHTIIEQAKAQGVQMSPETIPHVLGKMVHEGHLEQPAYARYAVRGYRQRRTDLGISAKLARK